MSLGAVQFQFMCLWCLLLPQGEFQKSLDSSDDEESHGPRKASVDMLPPMGAPPLFHGPHPPPRFAGGPMEMYHPNGPNPPPPGYCGPPGQSFGRVPPPPAPNMVRCAIPNIKL